MTNDRIQMPNEVRSSNEKEKRSTYPDGDWQLGFVGRPSRHAFDAMVYYEVSE